MYGKPRRVRGGKAAGGGDEEAVYGNDVDEDYGSSTYASSSGGRRGRDGADRGRPARGAAGEEEGEDDDEHTYGNSDADGAGAEYGETRGGGRGREGVLLPAGIRISGSRGDADEAGNRGHTYGNVPDSVRARLDAIPDVEPGDDYTVFRADRVTTMETIYRTISMRHRDTLRANSSGRGNVMTLFGATTDESSGAVETSGARSVAAASVSGQTPVASTAMRNKVDAKLISPAARVGADGDLTYVAGVDKLAGFFFPREWLSFVGELGEVENGRVVMASTDLGGTGAKEHVFVKMARDGLSAEELQAFMLEAKILARFSHPNVQRLVGVCAPQLPWLIVLEQCAYGELRTFLRGAAMTPGMDLTYAEQLHLCCEVSRGMAYLSRKMFVHRDLGARNCLVDAQSVVKVSGFGLARTLESGMEYESVKSGGRLPVRWMAPESLLYQKFSVMSDVWSFGVLMWEVLTFGTVRPYKGLEGADVAYAVAEGQILPKPRGCT